MARREAPVRTREQVEALVDYRDILEACAHPLASQSLNGEGRPRSYPDWVMVLYDALASVFRSARKVETELPDYWPLIRDLTHQRHPDEPLLPEQPPRRHHWQAAKARVSKDIWESMREAFEIGATSTALEVGLFAEHEGQSFTRPSKSCVMFGDGKVNRPLTSHPVGSTWIDPGTGKTKPRRTDPDAGTYTVGGTDGKKTKKIVYGLKVAAIMARTDEPHGRVLLGFDAVDNDEAGVAVNIVGRIAPRLPRAEALLYDTAFRGTHINQVMRNYGIPVVAPVAAKSGGRNTGKPRVEKERLLGGFSVPETGRCLKVYGVCGEAHVVEKDFAGEQVLVPLEKLRVERRDNADGTFRWYKQYKVSSNSGGGTLRVPLIDNGKSNGIAENHRVIAPSDPDYYDLYHRRSDIESQNRALDDSLWLGRARSIGMKGHLLDWMGYGLVTNAVTRARHRRRRAEQLAA